MVINSKVLTARLETAKLDGGILPLLSWLTLNAVDSITTHYIISNGGQEINLVYQLSHNMEVVLISKWVCVTLVMGYLYFRKVSKVLWAFSTIPLYACLFNLSQIL